MEEQQPVEEDIKPTMSLSSLLPAVRDFPSNKAGALNAQVDYFHKETIVPASLTAMTSAQITGYYRKDENFEDFYKTPNYTLLCRISETFYESIKHIMDQRAVGVAFEGQNRGCHGRLSLIQVATSSEVIIFDTMRLGVHAFEAGLKTVFESEDVMKVIHDCRWIADLLRCQHEITLVNVFDTQVADAFVCRNLNEGSWPKNVKSLSDCLDKYLNFSPQDDSPSQIREPLNEKNKFVWLERPLPLKLLDEAAKNALYLLKLQRVLLAELLVEFKAAVDIYLNYCAGNIDDAENLRITNHLLPQAFGNIYPYKGNRSQCHSQNNQESCGSKDLFVLPASQSQDLTEVQSEPNKPEEGAKKKKKMTYKKARKIILNRLQRKVKSNLEMSRDVLQSKSSTPSVSELQKTCADVVEETPAINSHITAEIESAVTYDIKQEVNDSSRSISGENVSASQASADEKLVQAPYQILAGGPNCAGVLRMSVSLEGTQTTELVEEPKFSLGILRSKVGNGDEPVQNNSFSSKVITLTATEKSYKCDICDEKFLRKKYLTKHKKRHITGKTYNCPVCSKTFSLKFAKEHKKIHPPYGCDLCGLRFGRVFQLTLHNRTHKSERPGSFQCDDCGKTFFTKSDLLSHKISHSEERLFKCEACGKAFKTAKYLRNHERRHAVEKPYVCEYCGKAFAVKDDLFAHMRRQHKELFTKRRDYQCDVCGEIFPNSRRLRRHTLKHSGQRPHKCDVCFKGFALAEDLYKHKAIHTGLKPFKCLLCDRSFIRSTQLKSHNARVHLNHKTFQCDVCNKWFGIRSDLNQHKKIHMEPKPQSYCGLENLA